MSKKNKNKEIKEEQEVVTEQSESAEVQEEVKSISVEEIRENRKVAAEAKKAAQEEELDQRDEFRKFFAKKREKLKLDSSMEHVLWLHFIATGHAEKEKFESGLKHFGIHN